MLGQRNGRSSCKTTKFSTIQTTGGQRLRTSTIFLSITSLILLLLPMTFCAPSTSNINNPYQQQHDRPTKFTPEERLLLRQAFLRKFGLDHLPTTTQTSTRKRDTSMPKVPDYIWALYQAHSTASPTAGALPAETIRHYGPSAVESLGNGRALLAFNLSATGRDPEKEQVLRAELRLPDWKMPSNGTLTIHRQTDGMEEALASTNSVNFERRRWIELDGQTFTHQTTGNGSNNGQETTKNELHLLLTFPSDIGQQEAEEMLRTAALIVFSNDAKIVPNNEEEPKQKSRQRRRAKRSVGGNSSRQREGKSRNSGASASSSSSRKTAAAGTSASAHHRHHRQHTSGQCRRAELYVDFAELNWQDWIMAPAGYEAYQCKGRCTHPMPSHLNTTNHAIVQSLIHSIDPSAAPAPSCVPVQMSPISILYRDINDVIVVKTYADMRVDACGCH